MVLQDNRAYQLDYQEWLEEPLVQSGIPTKKIVKKVRKKRKVKSRKVFGLIALTFGLCLSVLVSNALIAETNYKINQLNRDYENALKINSELNVQLMKSTNLDNLEQVAIQQLGMQYPEQYQYSYVSVNQVSDVEVASVESYYKAPVLKPASEKGIKDKALDYINSAKSAVTSAIDSLIK